MSGHHVTFNIHYDGEAAADRIMIHPLGNSFVITMFPHDIANKQQLGGDATFVTTYVHTMLEMLVSDDKTRACSMDVVIPGFPTICVLRENIAMRCKLIERALGLWLMN